jgi:diacylglycerol kinase (ATP)
MRAAAILGLGCSSKHLKPFQTAGSIEWRMGMPSPDDPADAIVLFGGDGTIHRHLSQLVKSGLPLLVVPAGSGNDFARALGLRRLLDSMKAWERFCQGAGDIRKIDLGTITPLAKPVSNGVSTQVSELKARYFCCVAGIGLDAEVSRRANGLPRWLRGNGGYVVSLLPAIFQFAPSPMKILTHNEAPDHKARDHEASNRGVSANSEWRVRSDQPTLLAAFANTPVYGGGMKIAPEAKMDDGLLDVCAIKGIDPFKLFCLFPTVYSGRHVHIKEAEYFQTKVARIETEHPQEVYADGEYICQTPVEIGLQRAALRVIAL